MSRKISRGLTIVAISFVAFLSLAYAGDLPKDRPSEYPGARDANLQLQIGAMQQQIDTLLRNVDSLAERACLNEKFINDLQSKNDAIMKLMNELPARAQAHSKQIDANSPEMISLSDRLEKNNAIIDYLREQIESINRTLKARQGIAKTECADVGPEEVPEEPVCEEGACEKVCQTCFEGKCFGLMCPDEAERQRWLDQYNAQPKLVLPQERLWKATAKGSNSILDHVPYNAIERYQGTCGNCWQWAGTGVLEVAHHVETGVFSRISVQYMNSKLPFWYWPENKPCCGGTLSIFADFYSKEKKAVPWDNVFGGFWDDLNLTCYTIIPWDWISTEPNWPIYTAPSTAVTVETRGVSQAEAIANIKAAIDDHKAVVFGYDLPKGGWDAFQWDWFMKGETAIFDLNPYCGQPRSGGHAVLLVGYNDTDPDPRNWYWEMLNSWGATLLRWRGTFRVNMDLNYDCTYPDGTSNFPQWSFETYDVVFLNWPPVAEANGPYQANEGSPITFSAWGSTDRNNDSLEYRWDFESNGTWDTPSSTYDAATHAYADDFRGTATVEVSDGTHTASDTAQVTVVNVAPRVSPPANQFANEGVLKMFNLGSFFDPGVNDAPWTVFIDWGDAMSTTLFRSQQSIPATEHTYGLGGVYTVTVTVTDKDRGSSRASFTITVNHPPVATNDSHTINEDMLLTVGAPGVLGNDTDADGDPLTTILLTQPSQGSLTLNNDGSFTYLPSLNYYGPDSFTYRAYDGKQESNVATVSLTVSPVNDPPVLEDPHDRWVAAGTNLDLTLVGSDLENEHETLTYSFTSTPSASGATLNATTGAFSWTPGLDQDGKYRVRFTVSDGELTDSKEITITVVPPQIPLSEDTFVDSGFRTVYDNQGHRIPVRQMNYGDNPGLSVIKGHMVGRESYLYWQGSLLKVNMPDVPSSLVKTAKLYLYHYTVWGERVGVYRMNHDWREMEATFEQPDAGGPSWATEWTGGGNYAAIPTAVGLVNQQNAWYFWDVTSDVKAFLDGAPNYGWFMKSAAGGPSDITSTAFRSKDAKEFRPYLEITLSGNQP